MSTMGPLSFRLLGPLEVRRGDTPLDLGSPKQRLLLAALVLARGRVVPAERLVDVVWGDDPPANASSNLQVYVSRLRALLKDADGASPLGRRAPGYALDVEPGALDVDALTGAADAVGAAVDAASWQKAHDTARAARGLWRGPVLADLEGDWFVGEATALHGRWLDLRCGLVTALLGLRRPEDAVAEALPLVDEAPLRDDVTRLAMLALHQAGRTAEALAVHARHVELLDADLGIEAAAEVRDLHVDLLRQEPWTSTWPAEAPSGTPAVDALVGREAELAVGERLVDEVLAGQVRALVLTGPAGIGKTRLAEELCDAVRRRGGERARGRSLDEPGAPPWWPLRQLVRELGGDPDVVLRAPGGADADTVRFAVYEQVRELVDARARRTPLALLVDDLQWTDPATLGCLLSLTATPRSVPVLLVVTVRDGEGDPAAGRAASALVRGPGARHLVVPPLDADEVRRLAERVAGRSLPGDELDGLAARTGGNALFVAEYARLPAGSWTTDELPLAISGVLARRLDVLAAEELEVLRTAAVVGEVWDPDVVGAVVGEPARLFDHLEAAAEAAIVAPDPGGQGYRFTHHLLRQQVLAGLSPVRRGRRHLAVATALTTAGPEQLTQRAQHLVAAGPLAPPRDVLDACRAAARLSSGSPPSRRHGGGPRRSGSTTPWPRVTGTRRSATTCSSPASAPWCGQAAARLCWRSWDRASRTPRPQAARRRSDASPPRCSARRGRGPGSRSGATTRRPSSSSWRRWRRSSGATRPPTPACSPLSRSATATTPTPPSPRTSARGGWPSPRRRATPPSWRTRSSGGCSRSSARPAMPRRPRSC